MIIWIWSGFIVLLIALLALDLGVFNRKAHVITAREALGWTAGWVAVSLVFNVVVYFLYEHHWLGIGVEVGHDTSGLEAAQQFFTGYLIEKSLSMDNIFVIAVIFRYFAIPRIYQHRVLFWGIFGAIVLRGAMIIAGAALIHRFDWIEFVFGGILILTAIRMARTSEDEMEPEKNPAVRLVRKFYRVDTDMGHGRFFLRLESGRRAVTPLFLALLVIETTDVVFAVDSIPAIFAITHDPFIVFTSNACAILGLRSLYFAIAAMLHRFRYIKTSLVLLLLFVGVKMLTGRWIEIPTWVSLVVIVGLLAGGVLVSLLVTSHADAATETGQTESDSSVEERRD